LKQSVHNETDIFVFVKATLAYFAVMTEAFIICFAGEYLSLKVSKYIIVSNTILKIYNITILKI